MNSESFQQIDPLLEQALQREPVTEKIVLVNCSEEHKYFIAPGEMY